MCADETRPDAEVAVEDDADVLTPPSSSFGDETTEETTATAPDAPAEDEEKQDEEVGESEQSVEEAAPEAPATEMAEAPADEMVEEADTDVEIEATEPGTSAEVEEVTTPIAEAEQPDTEIKEAEDDKPDAETEATEAEQPDAEVKETEVDRPDAEIEEPDPHDHREWYVIHCYSGYENKVKHNLEQRIDTMQMEDQIFQVVVPTEDEIEVRDGKRRVVERRVFPGYILVQMILNDDSWYVVRNTPGVTGFVGMGNTPTPLRTEEVQAIMRRMEAEAPKIKVTFKSGQKVRIIDGPFNEFIGVVDEIDMERAKVRVMVSFFGRETPVELDFLQVEKA